MNAKLQELRARLYEVYDLNMSAAVLRWDQATYMPVGGAPARGRQLALLGRLAHERLVDPAMGRLLDDLEPWASKLPFESDEAALVRVTRREYEQAARVPAGFVSEVNEHAAMSFQAWTVARPKNDFASVRPVLEKTLDLSRRYANFFSGWENIADPLIDLSDYGMKASSVRAVFGELRNRLVPIVQAITSRPPADDSCLRQRRPRRPAARVRTRGHPRVRLRLRARPPGPHVPPVHDQVLARRRSHHDARARERHRRRAVRHAARVGPRDVRAGHPARLRGLAARERHVGRRAREPVAAVGEPGRP